MLLRQKEVKTKGARGISLRVCVAKAAGWTLEKANSTTSQEASINKQGDLKQRGCLWTWKSHFKLFQVSIGYM